VALKHVLYPFETGIALIFDVRKQQRDSDFYGYFGHLSNLPVSIIAMQSNQAILRPQRRVDLNRPVEPVDHAKQLQRDLVRVMCLKENTTRIGLREYWGAEKRERHPEEVFLA
jgi:hypothetical protein